MWKIVARRQLEIPEAEALLANREVGPLEGFRSKLGRPFAAKLRLNDALEVEFDFGDGSRDGGDAEAPDFTGQEPLGKCPKCSSRVFAMPSAYVCEKAVGPDKTCDFRSGRVILQRPVERAQMQKLLASGKTDLLQFVSARTRRPFAAFLVRQPDGKIGFEFQAKDPTKGRGARVGRSAAALRVLGPHPKDQRPVELHSGRYGPYVRHGDINATLPDRDRIDALTLDEAVSLLAAKARSPAAPQRQDRETRQGRAAQARGVENPLYWQTVPGSEYLSGNLRIGSAPSALTRRPELDDQALGRMVAALRSRSREAADLRRDDGYEPGDRGRRRQRKLHVQVPDAERVQLDEGAARLDLVAHQLGEDLVGGDAVLDLHLEQPPRLRVHRRLPELLGIHFAQSLVPLDRYRASRFREQPVERFLERAHCRAALAAAHSRTRVHQTLQHVSGSP
jgi:hypothetical protein